MRHQGTFNSLTKTNIDVPMLFAEDDEKREGEGFDDDDDDVEKESSGKMLRRISRMSSTHSTKVRARIRKKIY